MMRQIFIFLLLASIALANTKTATIANQLEQYRKNQYYYGYTSTLISLSDQLLKDGKMVDAEYSAIKALKAAKLLEDSSLLITALNNLANIKSTQGFYGEALTNYQRALTESKDNSEQSLMIQLNLIQLYLKINQRDKAKSFLNKVQLKLSKVDNIKAFIQSAKFAQQLNNSEFAHKILNQAKEKYKPLKRHLELMLIDLEVAKLENSEKQYRLSEISLKQALFQSSFLATNQELYRIYQLMGNNLASQNNYKSAITYYQKAISHASKNRAMWTTSPLHHYRLQEISQLYGDYVQCLIESGGRSQKHLKEICRLMAELRICELKNYFRDNLVLEIEQKELTLEEIAEPDTTLVYTMTLDQQLALITYRNGEYQLTCSEITHSQLTQSIMQLRLLCQTNSLNINQFGKQLYQTLINPIENQLSDTKHIVFIPDTPLQSFPWALLHDGKNYLAERFSISTASGLTLNAPKKLELNNAKLLAAGLTSGLPNVRNEVEAIGRLFPGDSLVDKNLTKKSLEFKLRNNFYRIIHLATHADFSSDSKQHYLLTGDGKMDMKEFEQWIKMSSLRENGVELLTLSACKTAVGDELNNMGLAGTAIRSGAKSVLASLWPVDDKATALFMTEFYQNLKNGDSKASALKKAQQTLINHPTYNSPYYWAQFNLIGNWL